MEVLVLTDSCAFLFVRGEVIPMQYDFRVINDKMVCDKREMPLTGNVNTYRCVFEIESEIENLVWFCVFERDGKAFVQPILDNECFIPSEVLLSEGAIKIGCYGTNLKENDYKRVSTNWVYFNSLEGAYSEASTPDIPEPSVWEEIVLKAIPIIGENGNWFVFDVAQMEYVDSGVSAEGKPEIFIATYGVTTRAELDEAYESGKTIMCKYIHREGQVVLDFYGSLAQRSDFLEAGGLLTYTFSITVGKTIYNATYTHDPRANDLWQITEETIPEPEFYLANYGKTTIAQLNGAFEEGKVIIAAYPENGDYNKIKFFPIADRGVVAEGWVEVPATYTNDGTGITAQFDKSIEATDIRIQLLDTTHDTSPWAKPGYGIPESTYFPSWVGLNKVELFGVSNNELTIKGSDAWGQPLVFIKEYETSFGKVVDMYNNGFGDDYTYLYKSHLENLLVGANTYLGGGWWQTGGPGPVNHWPLNIDLNTGAGAKTINGLRITNFTASNMGVPKTIKVYKKNSVAKLPEIVYSFYCVDGDSISKITCSDGVWNITSSNYATEQYVKDAIAAAKESVMALLGG